MNGIFFRDLSDENGECDIKGEAAGTFFTSNAIFSSRIRFYGQKMCDFKKKVTQSEQRFKSYSISYFVHSKGEVRNNQIVGVGGDYHISEGAHDESTHGYHDACHQHKPVW